MPARDDAGVEAGEGFLAGFPAEGPPARPVLEGPENALGEIGGIEGRGQVWVHQIEGTLSYEWGELLGYGGLGNYTDLADLNLSLTPFLGAEVPTGLDGFKIQLEARYYAANRYRLIESVKFYNFDSGYGGFGMNLGLIWEIGQ